MSVKNPVLPYLQSCCNTIHFLCPVLVFYPADCPDKQPTGGWKPDWATRCRLRRFYELLVHCMEFGRQRQFQASTTENKFNSKRVWQSVLFRVYFRLTWLNLVLPSFRKTYSDFGFQQWTLDIKKSDRDKKFLGHGESASKVKDIQWSRIDIIKSHILPSKPKGK